MFQMFSRKSDIILKHLYPFAWSAFWCYQSEINIFLWFILADWKKMFIFATGNHIVYGCRIHFR